MTRTLAVFSALALMPAMAGPAAAQSRHEATVALCGGGAISIPLEQPQLPGGGTAPCCAKGCHAGQSRKRIDRAQ